MAPQAYHPRYQRFLVNLRQARLDAGLTQADVAQRLGRSQSYVSKCESGDRRVDFIELLEFARIYDRPLGYFVPSEEYR